MKEVHKSNLKPPLTLISRLITYAIWLLLGAEMLLLLLPRTVLDLRVLRFFFSVNDRPVFEGQALGMGILLGVMAVELFSLFSLWWLTLRCMKTTIKGIPSYIWIGVVFSVASMLNFVLPVLWTLVAIPLFSTAKIMGKLQVASLIVTATAFAVMYVRGKLIQGNDPLNSLAKTDDLTTKERNPLLSKKWKRGLIAVLIISIGATMLIPAKPQPPLTLEQAMKLNFRVSVKGAPFDIPVNYHYNEYSYFKKWPRPPQGQIDGTERREVDYIKATALLPDMAPYTAENAAEFEKPGGGKTVRILFGEEKNLDLLNASRNREKIENSKLPGMLQYEALSREQDQFYSPDYSISISCDNKPAKADWFPSCTVLSPYRYKQKIGNTVPTKFYFHYHFSSDYLQQWREIDEKVQALFDRFAEHAQHN
jgi:hypothetical protein